MRMHVGNGSIYLKDWVNVDLPLPHVSLAKDEPGLVAEFITTEDKYYARHEGKGVNDWRNGPNIVRTVCDAYGSFEFLPARPQSVHELLSRQCFEHLTIDRARPALKECARVLKVGGHLRLDVPDPEETLELYRTSGDQFWKRHLFGPRNGEFGFHSFYDRETITRLAADAGFNFEQEEQNIHESYPSFCLRFVRCSA